jgi:hypothetical protein
MHWIQFTIRLADDDPLIDKVAVKAFKLPEHCDLETINRVSSI